MEYIDIEKQIHQIRQSLESELRAANAIDENGHATNKKAFEEIVDRKIHEIEELEPMIADESGVARERYNPKPFFDGLTQLKEMRKRHAINIDVNSYSLEQGAKKEETLFKKHIFADGIHKLISKLTGRNRNQSVNESR